jgi:AcrR family transcriptional regulator
MSHEEPTDLRVRRTHKFLQEAMIALISEKGFDAITVGDIAERAMINRATFYRHYQDKYDLVARIFEETADSLVEHMKPTHKDAVQRDIDHTPELWVRVFAHFAEQSQLYRAMLGKNGSPWFVARMHGYIVKLILDNEQRWKPSAHSRQPSNQGMPETLPVVQLAHVLIGTIVWWLESDERYTPRQIATWFWRFAFYGYLAARGYQVPPA